MTEAVRVVITGPIQGTVTTADGTVYDVSADFIEVASAEHEAEVAELIAKRYVAEGHPSHMFSGVAFQYVTPAELAARVEQARSEGSTE
jgi:hypothetical protein